MKVYKKLDSECISQALASAKAALQRLPQFPVRMDEMTERELIIANMVCDLTGSLQFIGEKLEEVI